MNRAVRTALMASVLWLWTASPAPGAEPSGLLRGFETATAIFETGHDNCIRLNVWLADTPDQQRQGLMFVRRMGAFEGMLFRYPQDAVLRMWMKNTFVPLDMVFIDARQHIVRIEAGTEPLSERTISSRTPVRMALEINAGSARKWGLEPGHRLLLLDTRSTGQNPAPGS